ncbi:hypothetical protein RhiirC2_787633 [Rhizophagus irregularis]|uniref:Uncharacterized protein n=1 Tax=Rhizophagus irregularis TaxID=588596 RepID=A0A2N1MRT5_9GLOM|nr:hypothetical protein RhiirC2_787633 [Rhizophagus irregularis]
MVKNTCQLSVMLVNNGSLVQKLHYRPYSHFRVIKRANNLPEYYCISDQVEAIEASPTKAISTVYANIFKNSTRYSGHAIMGWNDENILEKLKNDNGNHTGPGFKSSIIHTFEKQQGIFVSEIENKYCVVEIYQDSQLKKRFTGISPDDVWKNTRLIQQYNRTQLFGLTSSVIQQLVRKYQVPTCKLKNWQDESIMKPLSNYYLKKRMLMNINWHQFFISWTESDVTIIDLKFHLKIIYPHNYNFDEREFRAWKAILHASGCTNVTPWLCGESEIELWTKSSNPTTEQETLSSLFKVGLLTPILIHMPNATHFTYDELQNNLGVRRHTISESRKHARTNRYEAPVLAKPIIHWKRFTVKMLDQFEQFFTNKETVNMSSYKTDTLTDSRRHLKGSGGLPKYGKTKFRKFGCSGGLLKYRKAKFRKFGRSGGLPCSEEWENSKDSIGWTSEEQKTKKPRFVTRKFRKTKTQRFVSSGGLPRIGKRRTKVRLAFETKIRSSVWDVFLEFSSASVDFFSRTCKSTNQQFRTFRIELFQLPYPG